jgi:amino acid transporter
MGLNGSVAPPDTSPRTLGHGRVGTAAITFLGLAASAPLFLLTTVVPAAYARGGGPLVPWTFIAVGVVLLLFAVGYAAMVHRAPFAGALYTYVTRGLGRPAGAATAWVAVLSYLTIQLGLYGLAGAAAAPLLDSWFHLTVPWWQVAAAGWLLVTLGGIVRIEITSGLLALIVLVEAALSLGYTAADVINPAAEGLHPDTIVPAALDRPVLGLLLVAGALAVIGFETTGAYAEESMRPRREAGRAVYATIIVLALLLAAGAWSLAVAAGPSQIGAMAGARGSELVFDLAAARLTPWAVTLGRLLALTGLVAALLALHSTVSRYLYALGRERALPGYLGRTGARTRAPRAASLTQSAIVGAVLAAGYLVGVDAPVLLGERLATAGGLGILVLLPVASVAALLYFNQVPDGTEGVWHRLVAPILSTVSLGVLVYLAFADLRTLLGVPGSSAVRWIVPAALGAAALLGVAHALILRAARPVAYAGIGQGGTPVVITPTVPEQPEPGRHRPERVRG